MYGGMYVQVPIIDTVRIQRSYVRSMYIYMYICTVRSTRASTYVRSTNSTDFFPPVRIPALRVGNSTCIQLVTQTKRNAQPAPDFF